MLRGNAIMTTSNASGNRVFFKAVDFRVLVSERVIRSFATPNIGPIGMRFKRVSGWDAYLTHP